MCGRTRRRTGLGRGPEPEGAKPETKPKSGAIEEITVRARKVAEKEQSTPVALTPYSEEAMEREITFSMSDLGGAPNVMLSSLGAFNATAFAIRGGSFQDIESSFEPAVGVVMDGMYLGRNSGSLLNLYDTESVEVLRGPQGVLFGRNSTSGMVVVRSRRPSGELSQRGKRHDRRSRLPRLPPRARHPDRAREGGGQHLVHERDRRRALPEPLRRYGCSTRTTSACAASSSSRPTTRSI